MSFSQPFLLSCPLPPFVVLFFENFQSTEYYNPGTSFVVFEVNITLVLVFQEMRFKDLFANILKNVLRKLVDPGLVSALIRHDQTNSLGVGMNLLQDLVWSIKLDHH